LYVTFAGSYSKTYGSLAAGVILMLWLNYSAWAILFGAELNSELEKQRRSAPPAASTPG
jgi:membrane protein